MTTKRRSTTASFTNLMRASAFGQVNTVRELLENGAEVNDRGPRGATALMFAASAGHLDIVEQLVEHGADIYVEEDGGWNARRHAEEDGHDNVADFLSFIESELSRRQGNA